MKVIRARSLVTRSLDTSCVNLIHAGTSDELPAETLETLEKPGSSLVRGLDKRTRRDIERRIIHGTHEETAATLRHSDNEQRKSTWPLCARNKWRMRYEGSGGREYFTATKMSQMYQLRVSNKMECATLLDDSPLSVDEKRIS